MSDGNYAYTELTNNEVEVYMRRFKTGIIFIMLISLSGTFLGGCSRPVPTMEDIKGKWLAIKKENYALGSGETVGFEIEFFPDKTVMLPSGKGQWAILSDGRLQIDIPGMTMFGELKKNLLTITMPKNQGKVIFKKQ